MPIICGKKIYYEMKFPYKKRVFLFLLYYLQPYIYSHHHTHALAFYYYILAEHAEFFLWCSHMLDWTFSTPSRSPFIFGRARGQPV